MNALHQLDALGRDCAALERLLADATEQCEQQRRRIAQLEAELRQLKDQRHLSRLGLLSPDPRELRDLAEEVRSNRGEVRVRRYRTPTSHSFRWGQPCDCGLILIDLVVDALERSADALTTHP